MIERPEELVGVPYLLGFAERVGADCWGLVQLAYRERFGIELPLYNKMLRLNNRVPLGMVRSLVREEAQRAWNLIPRCEAQPFDVVSLRSLRIEDHVGVVASDSRMILTTDCGLQAHLSSWGRGSRWDGRVCGVYRYAA